MRIFFFRHARELSLLTLLILIAYVNTINNVFLSDDLHAILNKPDLESFSTVTSNPMYSARAFMYMILDNVLGKAVYPYHLLNITLHIFTTWLVYQLLLEILNKRIAFFASALFAVHPLLSEAITWISGGVYVQYTFFLLLSFLFYRKSDERPLKYLAISLLLFVTALATIEKAIIFPAILYIYELAFRKIRLAWKKLIPYFTISLAWLIALMKLLPARLEEVNQATPNPVMHNPLQQIPIALFSYLKLFLWPRTLTLYHTEFNFTWNQYYLIVFVIFLFLTAAIYSYFKNKLVFFGLGLFIISLLPTLTPFGISWVVAERYVYFGTVGLFLVAGALTQRLFKNKPDLYLHLTLTILILLLGWRTILRNNDWQNEDKLWVATVKASPSSPNAHNNMGDVYARHNELENAATEFKKAIGLQPNYAEAYHNLGNTYQRLEEFVPAEQAYQKAAELKPELWQSHQNLSTVYFLQGDFEKAEKEMLTAININPTNHTLYTNMGIIYLKFERRNKAGEFFKKALQLNPMDPKAQQGLREISK